MTAVTPVNYSKGLLAASQQAEKSYEQARKHLEEFSEKASATIPIYFGPGCTGSQPNPQLKLARSTIKDLESRHKIFQACIRRALALPNLSGADAEKVFDLLQVGKFYHISLEKMEMERKSIETSNPSKEIDLIQQSNQAVPRISEFARANLVAIGTSLKNTKS